MGNISARGIQGLQGPLVFRVRGFEQVEEENGESYSVIQEGHCEMP